jgi:FkbM family methyltransferase
MIFRRGTGRWLQLLGGGDRANQVWRDAPRRFRVLYNRDLRAYVSVDLAQWYGRLHYYTGVYVDRENTFLIRGYLRPGDTFVDVGAHHGLHSVCAAVTVGPGGRVVSFEPNPQNYELLRAHLAINRLDNVSTHNMGLGERDAELTLNFSDPIRGSFLENEPATGHVVVPVRRGDDVLRGEAVRGRVLVKVDTEGFEHRVIRGMSEFLGGRDDVAVNVEVTDKWLRAAGSSQDELFAHMRELGFAPYAAHLRRFGPAARRVRLEPMAGPRDDWQYDVLFAKPAFLAGRG